MNLLPCTRLYPEDTLEAANTRIFHEETFTRWMVEHTTASTITHKDMHQLQLSTLDKRCTYFPLLPLSCTLDYLFWIYFQFTCTLWKKVLINGQTVNESFINKVAHALQVTTMIYEQSPQDLQNDIIRNFSLSADILVMCRVGVTTCEGIAYIASSPGSTHLFNIENWEWPGDESRYSVFSIIIIVKMQEAQHDLKN